MKEAVIILDFGSQYTQLIAKTIRSLGVYSVIYPYHTLLESLKKDFAIKGIIFSGGPSSVYDEGAFDVDMEYFKSGVPILGICYGMQLIAHKKGGVVESSAHKEYGAAEIHILKKDSLLFKGLPGKIRVWMSHGDHVTTPPKGFSEAASSLDCMASMEDAANRIYSLQFHPEVSHSEYGKEILSNFLFEICKIKANWTTASFIEESVLEVRRLVGDKKVLLALSGGVDSMTAAFLLHKAIGNQLICVFVDNGLLRKDEGKEVQEKIGKLSLNDHFIFLKTDAFLKALKGVVDPEAKRKIIGKAFIEVFNEKAKSIKDLGSNYLLAQGTLYPDVIESVSVKGPSDTIKTHHNRSPEVIDMIKEGRVIEPFKELFKDEVRLIAKDLGLDDEFVHRQPFPGPGLAVRILGEVTEERIKTLQEADWIVQEEVKKSGFHRRLWQYFAVLLPVKAVGVVGDNRVYADVAALRFVSSVDGMTADYEVLPKDVLTKIMSRITGEVKGVARVVLDITSKPPATIEWE